MARETLTARLEQERAEHSEALARIREDVLGETRARAEQDEKTIAVLSTEKSRLEHALLETRLENARLQSIMAVLRSALSQAEGG